MAWQERVVIDPKIRFGKPTIKGTRIAVTDILGLLADGYTIPRILEHYPHLQEEDVKAAIKYAIATITELEEIIVSDG